ncbi:MAG TPA: MOSC domain-containing protein [Gemmatales bacterium]|nr:MOSC domain-containing protein [Gemmatales bacterium]
MSWQGKVLAIHIGEISQPLNSVASVEAQAGVGLVGDRYGIGAGTFSKKKGPDREITLIEQEALDALEREYQISVSPSEARRNVTTEGVPLNHLVGKQFKVGNVVLQGIRLCEPCGHLEKLLARGKVQEGLRHRGGLRAQIVKGGVIKAGDVVTSI